MFAVVPCIGNVDWNTLAQDEPLYSVSRSLHWERGLKFLDDIVCHSGKTVVPCIGNVDWNNLPHPVHDSLIVVPCIGNVDWNQFLMESMNHYVVVPCIGNVDWNTAAGFTEMKPCRRSLHWERGLKSLPLHCRVHPLSSFPALGTWIEIYPRHGPAASCRVVSS